jgi:hypothetical protein
MFKFSNLHQCDRDRDRDRNRDRNRDRTSYNF